MPSFVCSLCGEVYSYSEHRQRCPKDGEPLDVRVDPGVARERVPGAGLLHHWQGFLPFSTLSPDLDLGVGRTPLVKARRLKRRLGIEQLYFKNEGLNPTGSFKDRGTVVGMQRALEMGVKAVGTVSSGNMAGSMAAFAARAGLECYVMVSSEIPPEKLGPIGIYRPHLTLVEGDYGELYREALRIGEELGIYFIISDDPFRVDGQKTVVLEICEQLNWEAPDYIFVPVSSGGNISGVLKGLRELEERGMISRRPKVVGVQAAGSSPLARAFAAGKQRFERFENPNTICHAITNANPPSGKRVLRWLEGGKYGRIVSVTDEEALDAQRLMAEEEGIWGQPDSAVPLAAIIKSLSDGSISPDDRVVAIVTGNGLKDQSIFKSRPVETKRVQLAGLADLVKSTVRG
ncbi:MAG TPA: threonine synthase [Chloroflexota bacterium]|nr:threonine synthase [Chloroflexota bacterium]